MFALLISDHFPVGNEDWFFEVCEGDGADAVKFACVAEDVALAALFHGSLFGDGLVDVRGCAAASSGYAICSEKAFGEMILLQILHCLSTDHCFCRTLEFSSDQKYFDSLSCQSLRM